MMAEFFAQSAQAIDGKGRPVYVRDNGTGARDRAIHVGADRSGRQRHADAAHVE